MNIKKILMVSALVVTMAAPAMAQSEVGQRQDNQQERIGNGVESGQLTAGETAKLETHEAAIHQEVKADRTANGGKLTTAEKAKVNRQQNRVSKRIYDKKHNARTTPVAK